MLIAEEWFTVVGMLAGRLSRKLRACGARGSLAEAPSWVGARHRLFDWTLGCIAVTDEEIDEVWSLVSVGTPVEIRP
jgi:hypothetical protein